MSTEEFKQALQESVNFPLRPYVLPFLKSHIPLLKRDIANLAKASNQVGTTFGLTFHHKSISFLCVFSPFQSILQYIRSNEGSVFEFVNSLAENASSDIFMSSENLSTSLSGKNGNDRQHQPINGNSRLLLKRRTSEG